MSRVECDGSWIYEPFASGGPIRIHVALELIELLLGLTSRFLVGSSAFRNPGVKQSYGSGFLCVQLRLRRPLRRFLHYCGRKLSVDHPLDDFVGGNSLSRRLCG